MGKIRGREMEGKVEMKKMISLVARTSKGELRTKENVTGRYEANCKF